MLMLRRSFLAVAAALCALTAGAENAKVKVGFIALPSHAPNFLAKERGFYAEEGLDAELWSRTWIQSRTFSPAP